MSSSETTRRRSKILLGASNSSNKHGQTKKVVSVKDSGSGIDSDIIPRLFDKFASKSYQGTGLGLFISK